MHGSDVRLPSQILLRAAEASLLRGLSLRLEATHIHISGRLRLALQLSDERPGIKGIYYVRACHCRGTLAGGRHPHEHHMHGARAPGPRP